MRILWLEWADSYKTGMEYGRKRKTTVDLFVGGNDEGKYLSSTPNKKFLVNMNGLRLIAQVKKPRRSPLRLRFLTCTLETASSFNTPETFYSAYWKIVK